MAAPSINTSPTLMKGKLSRVKHLLDDANQRLQEEASRFEIFTTQTSASSGPQTASQLNGKSRYVPHDLIRTITDVNTLRSVLSCPIFNRIVNVTDSLDKLSYHLNLHPSIGPSDININADGELILSPPLNQSPVNTYINTNPCEQPEQSMSPPRLTSPTSMRNPSPAQSTNPHQAQQRDRIKGQVSEHYIGRPGRPPQLADTRNIITSADLISSQESCNTEKLVASSRNPSSLYSNGRLLEKKENIGAHADAVKTNVTTITNAQFATPLKQNVEDIQCQPSQNSYMNELYNTTNEIHEYQNKPYANNQRQQQQQQQQQQVHAQAAMSPQQQLIKQQQLKNCQTTKSPTFEVRHAQTRATNCKTDMLSNRKSCSPATSAGSTVRLADECDSGASSYQSQTYNNNNNKSNNPYSPQPYKPSNLESIEDTRSQQAAPVLRSKSNEVLGTSEDAAESNDREFYENLSPEIERIQVTLEKDNQGLGITIAGYTCEKEEISGIFIKGITPNSPADRSGKVRTLDQIYSVNGRELLGLTNPEAVNVLRSTGKQVTLDLMRYLTECKFQKLQSALALALPSTSANSASTASSADNKREEATSPKKSVSPLANKSANISPTRIPQPTASPTRKLGSQNQTESIYKNESVARAQDSNKLVHSHSSPDGETHSQIPVAARRCGANKVIETKQGARNTIDIRSPACRTTSCTNSNNSNNNNNNNSSIALDATYVNDARSLKRQIEQRQLERTVQQSSVSPSSFSRTESSASSVDDCSNMSSLGSRLMSSADRLEWEKDVQIIELYRDPSSHSLGFTVKEYAHPRDSDEASRIIMVSSVRPGGLAECDGRIHLGDLLIFVDDTNLEGASMSDAIKALNKTSGQVRLGILKRKSS